MCVSLIGMKQFHHIAVIGGGAAGFFAAISAKTHHPLATVCLYEKTSKVLSKVKISGGGRCNVTNGCSDINLLCQAYPRGGKQLKKIFYQFNTTDTIEWFENKGVALKIEPDGRVFPVSNQSQSVIDSLNTAIQKLNIQVHLGATIQSLNRTEDQWELSLLGKIEHSTRFDAVIIATGGQPKEKGFNWLKALDHQIIPPIPSLFTFNMPTESITQLMGLVVEKVQLKIVGTKIQTTGPLLITHWGMSGPAILKASAFAARLLNEKNYAFEIQINWVNQSNTEILIHHLQKMVEENPMKQIGNQKAFPIPNRLWVFLLKKCGIPLERRWNEMGKKNCNKLVELLTNDRYQIQGKTTFKEEFVTCGGIALSEVNLQTMESKKAPNLYFAGEVLDIDAITGGYNFQAAWSTGYIAGKLSH